MSELRDKAERVWDTISRLSRISNHGATAWKVAKVSELQEGEVSLIIDRLQSEKLLQVTKVRGVRYFMPKEGAPEELPPYVAFEEAQATGLVEEPEKEVEPKTERAPKDDKVVRKGPFQCDVCEPPRVFQNYLALTIHRGKCAKGACQHRKGIVDQGREPNRKRRMTLGGKSFWQNPDGTWPCPEDGCGFVGQSKSGLGGHWGRVHGPNADSENTHASTSNPPPSLEPEQAVRPEVGPTVEVHFGAAPVLVAVESAKEAARELERGSDPLIGLSRLIEQLQRIPGVKVAVSVSISLGAD